ncbi:hypothetical protein H9X57_07675 [Flavobacterium piscinae]|uniref:Uncharacterized protein n=1 Tax=Flavobacterium piscinae TaxID=2506424 RepID=A0A4Q1KNX6_9FLAO|nr:hypothetical protein [Flavobacterium piscinae]MBC8883358.1 hypothetical protein [Flavobacterium piscinae]RXR31512.1 hypothetical protein EQG68_09630 [Flavobacterium piscinae]
MKEEKVKSIPVVYARIGYGLFILLGLYHVLVNGDAVEGAMCLAIGLIFDPFDDQIAWNLRPNWQKIWLVVHLGIAAGLLGYGMAVK